MDKNTSYVAVGLGAGVLGLIIGALSGDSVGKVETALGERISTIEEKFSAVEAQVGEVQAQVAASDAGEKIAGIEEGLEVELAALREEIGTVGARIDGVASDVEGVATEAAAAAGLEGKLGELEGSVGTLGQTFESLASDIHLLEDKMAALSAGAVGATSEGGDAASATTGEAASEDEAPGPADALLEAIGEDGLVLSVGETGGVGDQRIFLSRVDGEAGEAKVMIVGKGTATLSTFGSGTDLGNGCTLEMAGSHDGQAYLKPVCE